MLKINKFVVIYNIYKYFLHSHAIIFEKFAFAIVRIENHCQLFSDDYLKHR